MVHLESAFYGLQHLLVLLSKDVFRSVVGGDVESLKVEWYGASFDLSCASPPVSPYLKVVVKAFTLEVKVIYKDCLFSKVSVPPFVLGLYIE